MSDKSSLLDPWDIAEAVASGTGNGRRVALLVGTAPGSPNVYLLVLLQLWQSRAVYIHHLLTGEMRHVAKPSQELIDTYLALGRRIPHPRHSIQARDKTQWLEYAKRQATLLGLNIAK